MRALLQALHPPASEPYRLLEHLMNEGLQALAREEGRTIDVYDALFTKGNESAGDAAS